MGLWNLFGRRRAEPEPPAAALPARSPAWRTLPPVQRIVAAPSLITAPDRFPESLPVWQNPSRTSGGLGHLVSDDAPSGVGHGLVVATEPVQRAVEGMPEPARPRWWPLPSLQRRPKATVQAVSHTSVQTLPQASVQSVPQTTVRQPTGSDRESIDLPLGAPGPVPVVQRRLDRSDVAPSQPTWRLPAMPDAVVGTTPLVRAPMPAMPPVRLTALPLQRHSIQGEPVEQADPPEPPNGSVPIIAQRTEPPLASTNVATTERAVQVPPEPLAGLLTSSEGSVTLAAPDAAFVQRSVAPVTPLVRPRRLGLGAPVQRTIEAGASAPRDPGVPSLAESRSAEAEPVPAHPIGSTTVDSATVQRTQGLPAPSGVPTRAMPTSETPNAPADAAQRESRAATAVQRTASVRPGPVTSPLGSAQASLARSVTGTPGSDQPSAATPVTGLQSLVQRSTGRPTAGAQRTVQRAADVSPGNTTGSAEPVHVPPSDGSRAQPLPSAEALTDEQKTNAEVAPLVGQDVHLGSFSCTAGTEAPQVRRGVEPGLPLVGPAPPAAPAAVQVQRIDEDKADAGDSPQLARADGVDWPVARLVGERAIERRLSGTGDSFNASYPTSAPPSQPSVQRSIRRPGGGQSASASRPDAYLRSVQAAPVVQRLRFASDGTATVTRVAHEPAEQAVQPVAASTAAGAPATQEATEISVQREAGDAPGPPSAAPVGAPAAAGSTSPTEVDALVRRLYDPMVRRLKAELRLDRERAGRALDLRH